MDNSFFKATVAQKLKGNQPMPSDEELSVLTYEAIIYVATRTTPKSFIIKSGTMDNELESLRTIEEGFYIRMPETPYFDGTEGPNGDVVDIDNELIYATIFYTCFLIVTAKSGVPKGLKEEYLLEAERLISIFDSNFTRAGSNLYELI